MEKVNQPDQWISLGKKLIYFQMSNMRKQRTRTKTSFEEVNVTLTDNLVNLVYSIFESTSYTNVTKPSDMLDKFLSNDSLGPFRSFTRSESTGPERMDGCDLKILTFNLDRFATVKMVEVRKHADAGKTFFHVKFSLVFRRQPAEKEKSL